MVVVFVHKWHKKKMRCTGWQTIEEMTRTPQLYQCITALDTRLGCLFFEAQASINQTESSILRFLPFCLFLVVPTIIMVSHRVKSYDGCNA